MCQGFSIASKRKTYEKPKIIVKIRKKTAKDYFTECAEVISVFFRSLRDFLINIRIKLRDILPPTCYKFKLTNRRFFEKP